MLADEVSLIGGEPAELVDAHWLFAQAAMAGSSGRSDEQPVCRIPLDDPWMQNMLRPIVEAAGYLVIGETNELVADLTIVSDSRAQADDCKDGRVLRLASDPDGADGADSIYRYDRAGLRMALKSVGSGRA